MGKGVSYSFNSFSRKAPVHHYGSENGYGSAPPKHQAKRPQRLKPMTQQPKARQQPMAFATFSVKSQLKAADLAYDLLPEPTNANKALTDAMADFSSEDWETKCEGLNLIRSVVKFQPQAILESSQGNQMHTVNLAIITEMKNLRSQVARLGIQTMREMIQTMKRAVEVDAENIAKVLLARTGDTNQFLRADAEQALTAMAQNLSANKAMTTLLQAGLTHRNVSVRRSTSQHLLEVVERMGPNKALCGSPEVTGQLLPAMVQFLGDGSPEARFYARKLCHLLVGHPDFDKLVQKFCTPNALAHAKDIIETVRTKGPGELNAIGSSTRLSETSLAPTTPMGSAHSMGSGPSNRQQIFHRRLDDATQDHVREIIASMASNDWRQKLDGISGLVQLTESSPEVTAAQLTKLFDKFCPLLKDMNSKVNSYALQAFQSMLPMISNEIGSLVPLIMQHLTINLSSKSHEIQQGATGAMHALLAYVDPAQLLQPFANQTATANSRNKAFLVERLAEVVDAVCERKMKQVTLHILPLLWNMLGQVTQSGHLPGSTGNLRHSATRLASVLYNHMGEDLIQHAGAASLPEKHLQLLHDLIAQGTDGNINSANQSRNQGPSIGEDLDSVVANDLSS